MSRLFPVSKRYVRIARSSTVFCSEDIGDEPRSVIILGPRGILSHGNRACQLASGGGHGMVRDCRSALYTIAGPVPHLSKTALRNNND